LFLLFVGELGQVFGRENVGVSGAVAIYLDAGKLGAIFKTDWADLHHVISSGKAAGIRGLGDEEEKRVWLFNSWQSV
jgi:hypothetical protein